MQGTHYRGVRGGLWPVAAHVDFLDDIRNLLLFQLQPDLLTVRAPSGMISAAPQQATLSHHRTLKEALKSDVVTAVGPEL